MTVQEQAAIRNAAARLRALAHTKVGTTAVCNDIANTLDRLAEENNSPCQKPEPALVLPL